MIWPFDQVWTQQPQIAQPPNWAHPLSNGLLDIGYGAISLQKSKTSPLTIAAGSPSIGAGIGGTGPTFSGGGAQRFDGGPVPAISGGFTIEVLCAITAAPSLAGFYGVRDRFGFSDIGESRALIAFSGGSNRNIYFWGSSFDLASGVDWRIDGSLQHVFVTSDGAGTVMRFYRDGVQIASGTTPAIIPRPAQDTFFCGDTNAGWNSTPTGTLFKRAYYTRSLSAAEVAALTANPWQLFAKRSNPIFVGLGSPAITAYYPGSDISVAGWTSSSGGSLYADIDDVTLDRGDYITSPDLSTTATFGWKDSNGNPATIPAGTWSVDLDAAYFLGASGQVRLVWLDAGGSSVGATSWQTLTSTDTTYTLSITTTGASTQFRYEDAP